VKVESILPDLRYQVQENLIIITSFMKDKTFKLSEGTELFNLSFVKTTEEEVDQFVIHMSKNSGIALNKSGERVDMKLSTIKFGETLPNTFELFQNYPNPFNPSTTIKYSLPTDGLVKLQVYNVLGEVIIEPVNEIQKQGRYNLKFNANNFASGVYIYSIQFENQIISKKMILMR